MNAVAAKIYAFGMRRGDKVPEAKIVEAGELLGEAAAELNRLHDMLGDPFIRGYLEARKDWVKGPLTGAQLPLNGEVAQ